MCRGCVQLAGVFLTSLVFVCSRGGVSTGASTTHRFEQHVLQTRMKRFMSCCDILAASVPWWSGRSARLFDTERQVD